MSNCDCGAETNGKWADVHEVGCASNMTSKPAGNTHDQDADRSADRKPREVRGEHDWFTYGRLNWECCRVCGVVRRKDGGNSPCRGPVAVGLREAGDLIERSQDDLAANLRKWADVLEIPSGPFVNEDLRAAATALATQDARIKELEGQHDALLVALKNLRAAFDGMRPFPLVIEAVAAGLVKEADAAILKTEAR